MNWQQFATNPHSQPATHQVCCLWGLYVCCSMCFSVRYSMLQCVAVCVAVCCSVCCSVCCKTHQVCYLWGLYVCCSVCCSVRYSVLQCVLQCVTVCGVVMQCVAVSCSVLQCALQDTSGLLSMGPVCVLQCVLQCALQCVLQCVLQDTSGLLSVGPIHKKIVNTFYEFLLCARTRSLNTNNSHTSCSICVAMHEIIINMCDTGCLKLQVSFRKRATNYRALLQEMSSKDKASFTVLCVCPQTHTRCSVWAANACNHREYVCMISFVCTI